MSETVNYGGLPSPYAEPAGSRIVVLPVPYDRTSTWKKGADRGPEAIFRASANMELYDIETDSEVYRRGIWTDAPVAGDLEPEELVATVHRRVQGHLANRKFVVVVGGEHSVSTGAARAHVERYPDLTVLQLDAHTDLRDEYEGSKYSHACVMARIREMCPIVQVGIRSMDAGEKPALVPDRVFFAEKICGHLAWIDDVVAKLTGQVYLTIDLDVFDPAIMPSTGTPEPGGLMWYDVLALIRAVGRRRTVVGFDVVEMCPVEANWAPDFLAAKLIYKTLSYVLEGDHGQARSIEGARRAH
ncbi:MAG: agmatinase [Planctomycetes bacterium]|jgi:agmatinase|nr:agmatinase [Planctomycetota bacterium]